MDTEAIQEDVSVKKTAHDNAYEALLARREKEAGIEPQEETEETEEIEEETTEETEEVTTEETEEPMLEFIGADGNVIKVPATAKYIAKIDGEEIEQSLDNITRSYQKGAAGDKRLELATQRMREAERIRLELDQKQTDLTAKERAFMEKMGAAKQQKKDGDLSEDGYKKAAAGIFKALTEGDDENVEAQIAEALKMIVPKTVDEDAILTKAEERSKAIIAEKEKKSAEQRAKSEQDKANAWFKQEHSEIFNDPIKISVAKAFISTAKSENPNASPLELAKIAGEKTVAYYKELSGTGRPKPKPTPKPVSARATIGKDEKPETRQDIFNEMRKQRNQAVY